MKQFSKYFKSFLVLCLVFSGFIFPGIISAKEGANFFLSPSVGTYKVNEELQVELKFNTSKAVTSVKAYLNFDSSLLAATKIDTENSDFSSWWENTYTQENPVGQIKIQASSPSPGFTGEDGLIAKINFKVLKEGTVKISYDSSSLALLLNDENILNLDQSLQGEFKIEGVSFDALSSPIVQIFIVLVLIAVILGLIFREKILKTFRR